jgi:hypothetical protein
VHEKIELNRLESRENEIKTTWCSRLDYLDESKLIRRSEEWDGQPVHIQSECSGSDLGACPTA